MELEAWLRRHGGVAHRTQLARAGFSRDRIARSELVPAGRFWLGLPTAPVELLLALASGGGLACVSAAAHLGLQVLSPPAAVHVALAPKSSRTPPPSVRPHRSIPLQPVGRHDPLEPIPDMLAHVASCLPRPEARVVWESALRRGLVTRYELRRVPWRSRVARSLAEEVSPQSDSLLESLLAEALRETGLPFQQQVPLLGHRVDFLIAGRLVVQLDGYEFHADARQRRADLEHDARLRLAGYEVLRFDYWHIVHRLEATIAIVRRLAALAVRPA